MLVQRVNKHIRTLSKNMNCRIGECHYSPIRTLPKLQCHKNCEQYNRIIGFYIYNDTQNNCYKALHHSVIIERGKLIDITPNHHDETKYIFLIPDKEIKYSDLIHTSLHKIYY